MVDGEQVRIQKVGAILGVLEVQRRLNLRLKENAAHRFGDVVIGAVQQHLAISSGVARPDIMRILIWGEGGLSRK